MKSKVITKVMLIKSMNKDLYWDRIMSWGLGVAMGITLIDAIATSDLIIGIVSLTLMPIWLLFLNSVLLTKRDIKIFEVLNNGN